jgi:hypothetical protein
MKKMMIHRVAFRCSWIESFACVLFNSFSSRNDIIMKWKNRNNCEIIFFINFIVVERLNFFFIFFTFHVSKQFNLLTIRNFFWYFKRQYSKYSRDFVLFFTNEQVHFFYSLIIVFFAKNFRSFLLRSFQTKVSYVSLMLTFS